MSRFNQDIAPDLGFTVGDRNSPPTDATESPPDSPVPSIPALIDLTLDDDDATLPPPSSSTPAAITNFSRNVARLLTQPTPPYPHHPNEHYVRPSPVSYRTYHDIRRYLTSEQNFEEATFPYTDSDTSHESA